MSNLGVDYSFARPSPQAIKAAGYDYVLRYLAASAPARPKVLTVAERDALWAAGLGIGLVWEEGAQRAKAGRAAGVSDAFAVAALGRTLGLPEDVVVFFAVDYDAAFDDVRAYFEGVRSVRTASGCYGGAKVIDPLAAAGLIVTGWQAGASSWSNGQLSPHASIVQRTTITVAHPLPRGSVDENAVLSTAGWLWLPPAPPTGISPRCAAFVAQTKAAIDAEAGVLGRGGDVDGFLRLFALSAACDQVAK